MSRFIQPTVDRATAWRKLHRPGGLAIAWAWVRRHPDPRLDPLRTKGAPLLRLVYLPRYLVGANVQRGDQAWQVHALVDAIDGVASLLKGPLLDLETESIATPFKPLIDAAQAATSAERLIRQMSDRYARWSWRPTQIGLAAVEPVYYPFWAYYCERGKGILDVSLYDAWAACAVGARVKAAYLTALASVERPDAPARAAELPPLP
ncbi:MAG: hypothetical protein K1X74_09580 [Pirellulales bacterium]|nr:hypothetical protein [Pirellulales bacterium]